MPNRSTITAEEAAAIPDGPDGSRWTCNLCQAQDITCKKTVLVH